MFVGYEFSFNFGAIDGAEAELEELSSKGADLEDSSSLLGLSFTIPMTRSSSDSANLGNIEMKKLKKTMKTLLQEQDMKSWIFKSNQCFDLDNVKEPNRVKLAAIHLEDKLLLWNQTYIKRKNKILPKWEDYMDITAGFGDIYDHPMADLKALKQTGSVQEYHDSFNALASRIELSEPCLLSCYLAGLEDDIQLAYDEKYEPGNKFKGKKPQLYHIEVEELEEDDEVAEVEV
uniref:Retrotransposon gag domain-containing protein n=1 Tax=Chenopodium quinoa TaxID=63459 RepID=A0A803N9J9_CHEQI